MRTADDLFREAFGATYAENKELLLINDLPIGKYKCFPLERLSLNNPDGKSVTNCKVWFQEGHYDALVSRVKINIFSDVKDIHLYFFNTPIKGSKLTYNFIGHGHRAVFLSRQPVSAVCRLMRRNATLAIGEGVRIVGCKFVLDDTICRIGAGGLWSDGILVQGTDSHGIVDLNLMKVINDAPKYITFGRRVWIGRDVKIMKNITIGDGSLVGTGAMVTKDITPASIAVGFPAKVIKTGMSWSGKQDSITPFEEREMGRLKALPQDVSARSLSALVSSVHAPVMGTKDLPVRSNGMAGYLLAGAAGAGMIEILRLFLAL